MAARELSSSKIATGLGISRRTVEGHLQRAYEKFSVTSRSELGACCTFKATQPDGGYESTRWVSPQTGKARLRYFSRGLARGPREGPRPAVVTIAGTSPMDRDCIPSTVDNRSNSSRTRSRMAKFSDQSCEKLCGCHQR